MVVILIILCALGKFKRNDNLNNVQGHAGYGGMIFRIMTKVRMKFRQNKYLGNIY